MLPYPLNQKTHARKLRRDITDAEKKLWAGLRDRQLCGAKFRRQHPIGPFITDFCCVERGLVVELAVSMRSKARRIKLELIFWSRAGIACYAFGTTMF